MNEEEQKIEMENAFLDKHIFQGLKNLNDGFDSPEIQYFSEDDFEIVLQRVRKMGLGIYGIEPWRDGEFFDVKVFEQGNKKPTDPNWYLEAFEDFKNTGEKLLYAATYHIPDDYFAD